MSPVSLALQDRNPYVRRTAVLGVLKIYNLDAAAVRNAGKGHQQGHISGEVAYTALRRAFVFVFAGMLEDLHSLLESDPDAQVVANCMSVLLEVTAFRLMRCKAFPCALACLPTLGDVQM